MAALRYSGVQASVSQSSLTSIAQYMFWLMMRNVASDGFVFDDPVNAGVVSAPGCVLASPSWESSATDVTQDYVYNWTRDAAIVAMELAAGTPPTSQPLVDYVQFAQICQSSGAPTDRACFLISGSPREWTDQTDGPALQTLAILQLFAQLDPSTQAIANAVIETNLEFLAGAYQGETFNLWEEHSGASFFARAVQLRCFQEVQTNTVGLAVPFMAASQERYRMRHTFYGNVAGRFEGSGWRLFLRGILLWVVVIAPFVYSLEQARQSIDWSAIQSLLSSENLQTIISAFVRHTKARFLRPQSAKISVGWQNRVHSLRH